MEQYSELRFPGRKLIHDTMNGDYVNCPLVHKTSTPTFQRRTEEQNKPLLSLFPCEGISFLDKQRLDGERLENILNNALTEKRDT